MLLFPVVGRAPNIVNNRKQKWDMSNAHLYIYIYTCSGDEITLCMQWGSNQLSSPENKIFVILQPALHFITFSANFVQIVSCVLTRLVGI